MPVILNKETGLAENVPDQNLATALKSQTHELPLYSPEGEFGSANMEDAQRLLQEGYRQPSPDELKSMLRTAKFNSTEQKIKTGLEGIGTGSTFGLSTGVETALGVKPEDIRAREEANPGIHMAGEAVGLIGSMFTGVGEGALLGKAGTKAAAIIAPKLAENFVGRVGTKAAAMAAENMLFQSGNEVHKLFAGDPHQSMETAVADVGMAGLIGAGFGGIGGSVSELWKMGPGKTTSKILGALTDKSSGLPSELKVASGITVPPEIEAALSNHPEAQEAFATLMESNSSSGKKAQMLFNDFRTQIQDTTATVLGTTPELAREASEYEIGKIAQQKLATKLNEIVKPISERYEQLEEKFAQAVVAPEARSEAATKISQAITDGGLLKGPNESAVKLANKTLEKLDAQVTAQDVRNYIKGLNDVAPYGSENYQIGKQLKTILRDLQDSTINSHMAEKAPEIVGEFQANQAAYKGARELIDELNDRLHVGKHGGPSSFVQALKEMAPEDVIKRLSPKGDADMQRLISEQFPEVKEIVRQNELNKLIKNVGGNGEVIINPKKLFNKMEALSPEMKSFIFSPEQQKQLTAIKDLMDRVPNKMNPSGTAKTIDKLWGEVPASAAGMAAMAMGHSGPLAYIMTKLGTTIGKEAPDAVRMAMLKFLGSSAEVSATGFRSAVNVAAAIAKGEAALNKGVKAIFGTASMEIAEPTQKERDKLEKQINEFKEDPAIMLQGDNSLGHYMPDHATAASMIAARNLQYLASLKPNEDKMAPLDAPNKPSDADKARYTEALNIAQNPLIVLKHVKEGSLTPQDIQHLHNLYPALYPRMVNKITEQMMGSKDGGMSLPYKTKLGISAFTATPLDSSMSPASIQSAQNLSPQQQPQGMAQPSQIKNVNKLDKLPNSSRTPQQQRSMFRSTGH